MKKLLLLPLIILFFSAGCNKEPVLNTEPLPVLRLTPVANKPPVANAGRDTTITLPVDSVKLDGSTSYDPDGQIASYNWRKISGPASFNISSQTAQPTLKNLVLGVYSFELKVTDTSLLAGYDTIAITVNASRTNLPTNSNCGFTRTEIKANLMSFATLSQARTNIAIASAGNKIVFAGGESTIGLAFSSRVDIFDLTTNSWTTAELSEARTEIATTVLGKKIFFAGGRIKPGNDNRRYYYSGRVDIYDTETNTWTNTTLPNEYGAMMTAAAAGNKVVVAHNYNFHIYDELTNTWSIRRATGLDRNFSGDEYGKTATTVNNLIYFAGGSDEFDGTRASWSPSQIFFTGNGITVYNALSNTWSFTNPLTEPKAYAAGISVGNTNLWAGGFTGGYPGSVSISAKVEIRDMITGQSDIGCLFQPNAKFSAVQKNSSVIFFTGEGQQIDKFDIYNLNSKNWSVGVMPKGVELAAIISVNNIVYVAGGKVNGAITNQVYKLEF